MCRAILESHAAIEEAQIARGAPERDGRHMPVDIGQVVHLKVITIIDRMREGFGDFPGAL